MLIKQISVFLENTTGRLSKLTGVLAEGGIDIIAISIADTTDFGILRCIVDKPDKAVELLRAHNFTASITKVVAVEIEDKPGGLAAVLSCLSAENISIEYVYSFVRSRNNKALILFKVNDAEKALPVLAKQNIKTLCLEDIVPKDAEVQ